MTRRHHSLSSWRLLLRALSDRGAVVVLATNDVEAAEVCDAHARLHEGELDWARPLS